VIGSPPSNTASEAFTPHTEAMLGKSAQSYTENNQSVKPKEPTIKTIMLDIKSLVGSKMLSAGVNKNDLHLQNDAQVNNAW
jgi:hypothetical protein